MESMHVDEWMTTIRLQLHHEVRTIWAVKYSDCTQSDWIQILFTVKVRGVLLVGDGISI